MIHIYAEGIHTGGGLLLLEDLLTSKSDYEICGYIDHRIYKGLRDKSSCKLIKLEKNPIKRIIQKIQLSKEVNENDKVVWMNGIIWFKNKGKNIIYVQNYLLYADPTTLIKEGVKLKNWLKWIICRIQQDKDSVHYVQTEEMMELVKKRGIQKIKIMPFYSKKRLNTNNQTVKKYDYVYPADGVKHKNHKLLIKAMIWLAERKNYKPSVVLTLGKRDRKLWAEMRDLAIQYNLNIINIGSVSHSEMLKIMNMSKKLVYVSKIESYGLPLIEAKEMGLDIIAPELDYVRSICIPNQTFDVKSYRSLARAILRGDGYTAEVPEPSSAEDCIESIMEE